VSIPETHLAQEAIAALVDGELAPGPAQRAAKHLYGCAQCRMAVEAQREAKEALHRSCDVAVPGDLLSRLQAIPFTADVPGSGVGTLAAGPDQLTLTGSAGAWAVPLGPQGNPRRPDQARWLRRGAAGTAAALGLGVLALALNLPADGTTSSPARPVARSTAPVQHTTIVPPVIRTVTVRTSAPLPGRAVDGAP
jgi:anti-sigma factor RsiW